MIHDKNRDKDDYWASWRVKPSFKENAFDWLIDRILGIFLLMDKMEAWWQKRWGRKDAKK